MLPTMKTLEFERGELNAHLAGLLDAHAVLAGDHRRRQCTIRESAPNAVVFSASPGQFAS
jgi:hypothetical protein